MMAKKLILILLALSVNVFAAKPVHNFARIKTDKGELIIMLYNETPKHRDNFIKLAAGGYYNGTLFHRVIHGFMIQGGDPDSKNAAPGQMLGSGSPGYRVDAEFRPDLFHKKGALAAARDGNPQKASSGSQFYIVQGMPLSDQDLDRTGRRAGRKIPSDQKQAYKTLGGSPHLDQEYTVFGEVVKGLDVIDSIAAVQTGMSNRPLEDMAMKITLLKKRKAHKLERTLNLTNKP